MVKDQRGRRDGSSGRTLEEETEEKTEHSDTDSVWLGHDHDLDRVLVPAFLKSSAILYHQSP